jgi:Uma2 family endonuclease
MMILMTPRARGSMMAISDPKNQYYNLIPSPFVGRSMTLAEFQALPWQKPPLEFVDGVVYQRPLLYPTGSAVRGELASALRQYGREREHGVGLGGVDCLVGETLLVPAVSYYGRATLRARGIRSFKVDWGAPDLAAEIVPTEPDGLDVRSKLPLYLNLGIPLVLLVDVDTESILLMRPGREPVTISGDDRIDIDDVVPGFDLTVRTLFHETLPTCFFGPRDRQADDDAAASVRSDG